MPRSTRAGARTSRASSRSSRREYTFLAFRAVENRVALVKADRAYDSVVVAPTGQIVAVSLSARPRKDTPYAEVAPGRADSVYTRLGDLLGWLCLASIPAFIVLDQATARRVRRVKAIA